MALILTPDQDPTCQSIASLLQDKLNALTDHAIVNQIFAFDGFASGQGLNFPILQIFRLSSKGPLLQESELRIEYYLADLNAVFNNPGILRFVEVAIVHILRDLDYDGLADEIEIQANTIKMQRGFLNLKESGIFPYTRLSMTVQEVNVSVS